jgi:hypothetical protein
MSDVKPYAVGICRASVCAPKDTPIEEVEREVNGSHPTGIASPWRKSDDDAFSGGEPNPCPCNSDPERLHWLLDADGP